MKKSIYMTKERLMIQKTAREFTNNEVLPIANELDPVKGDIPDELVEKIADMGFFGLKIPEEYGGFGLGTFEYCLVAEELSRGWMSVGSLIARGNASLDPAVLSEQQKQHYLPKIAAGELISAAALSEPDVGSDLAAISCRAERDGDSWNHQWQQVLVYLRGPSRPAFCRGTHQSGYRSQKAACGHQHVPDRKRHGAAFRKA